MFGCSAVAPGSSSDTCKMGLWVKITAQIETDFKKPCRFLCTEILSSVFYTSQVGVVYETPAPASLAGAEVTFPSHWKCRVATDKLTCRGISRCSFRLLQTQQLEHAWALPHKGALWRRPINLPKASKKQKSQCGPLSLVPGARRTGVLGRLCGVSLGPGSNRWGWDKGTGWCTCAL